MQLNEGLLFLAPPIDKILSIKNVVRKCSIKSLFLAKNVFKLFKKIILTNKYYIPNYNNSILKKIISSQQVALIIEVSENNKKYLKTILITLFLDIIGKKYIIFFIENHKFQNIFDNIFTLKQFLAILSKFITWKLFDDKFSKLLYITTDEFFFINQYCTVTWRKSAHPQLIFQTISCRL